MNDPWNIVEEEVGNSEEGLFLKLEDGESAEIVFCGMPHPVQFIYVDRKPMPVTQELLAKGYKATSRIRFNVWMPEKGFMKIFEMSHRLTKQVITCRNEYGADRFPKILFKVSRSGEGLNTTYQLMYKRELSADELAVLGAQELHSLECKKSDEAPAAGAAPEKPQKSGKPAAASLPAQVVSAAPPASADVFEQDSPRTVEELVAFARTVSRDLVAQMKKEFGVTKVSFIPADRVEEAFAFLEDEMF